MIVCDMEALSELLRRLLSLTPRPDGVRGVEEAEGQFEQGRRPDEDMDKVRSPYICYTAQMVSSPGSEIGELGIRAPIATTNNVTWSAEHERLPSITWSTTFSGRW